MPVPDVENAAQRTISRNKRLALSEVRRTSASQRACEHVLESPWWKKIKHIALYAAYGSEIDPQLIEVTAQEEGKKTYHG